MKNDKFVKKHEEEFIHISKEFVKRFFISLVVLSISVFCFVSCLHYYNFEDMDIFNWGLFIIMSFLLAVATLSLVGMFGGLEDD